MSGIKNLPFFDKPREKALQFGIGSLSNAELLALIIRTGTRETSALEVAEEVLKMTGGVSGISNVNIEQLCTIKGISKVKALELLAVLELQRRSALENVMNKDILKNSQDIRKWLVSEIGRSVREEFLVIYLNRRNYVISYSHLFQGTFDRAYIHLREIFREALAKGSASLILAHNHPSGELMPSREDLALTVKIIQIGNELEIEIKDHILVGSQGCLSFKDSGILSDCLKESTGIDCAD